jgi:hypothetical protein
LKCRRGEARLSLPVWGNRPKETERTHGAARSCFALRAWQDRALYPANHIGIALWATPSCAARRANQNRSVAKNTLKRYIGSHEAAFHDKRALALLNPAKNIRSHKRQVYIQAKFNIYIENPNKRSNFYFGGAYSR